MMMRYALGRGSIHKLPKRTTELSAVFICNGNQNFVYMQLPMDCVKENALCKQVKYLRVDCHGLREPKDNHPCIVTCGSSKKDERV